MQRKGFALYERVSLINNKAGASTRRVLRTVSEDRQVGHCGHGLQEGAFALGIPVASLHAFGCRFRLRFFFERTLWVHFVCRVKHRTL